jgi:hypothetical protein
MMRPTARPVDRTADARERPTERPNDEAPSANPHSSTTERRDVLARGATRRDHPRRPNPRSREDKTAGIREIALGRDDACLASLLRAKTRVLRGRDGRRKKSIRLFASLARALGARRHRAATRIPRGAGNVRSRLVADDSFARASERGGRRDE